MNKLHLGWIPPRLRTEAQHEAHAAAVESMVRFDARKHKPAYDLGPGEKLLLTDTWKHAATAAQLGFPFPGFHQLTGSCFPAGTPVRMADGSEKPIELVQQCDMVVSHEGHSLPVTNTFKRSYSGTMVKVSVRGFPFPLEMTADHKVPVATVSGRYASRWPSDEIYHQIEWKRADELTETDRLLLAWGREPSVEKFLDVADLLKGHVIVLDDLMEKSIGPVSNIGMAQWICKRSGIDWRGRVKLIRGRSENAIFRTVPITPSLGRLLGIYLAEGGCNEGRVTFTLNARETALAAEILSLVYGLFGVDGEIYKQSIRPTVLKVRFNNSTLAAVFKALMPGNVYGKRVPAVICSAQEDVRLAAILGWMAGDGYAAKTSSKKSSVRIQGVTVCAGLARDMTTLALSCGLRASCSIRQPRGRSKPAYDVYLSGAKAVSLFPAIASAAQTMERLHDHDSARQPSWYARTIKQIETREVSDLPVYDFEVLADHSFVAGGIAVHNCVGNGGGHAIFTLNATDVLLRGTPEGIVIPFWPLTYGMSRYLCGDRGQGEGSLGSTFAQAASKYGTLDATESTLPQFTNPDGLEYTEAIEMQWSNGATIPQNLFTESEQHIVHTTTPLHSADDVWNWILSGKPVTRAFEYFCNPGSDTIQGTGDSAVCLGKYDGEGGHQESWLGIYNHPTLGKLIWEQNSWGVSDQIYKADPAGGARGGVWQTFANVDKMCKLGDAEIYGFSGFDSYPAQNILARRDIFTSR